MAMTPSAGEHSTRGQGTDIGFSEHIGDQHTLNLPAKILGHPLPMSMN